jgi:hypothetical protein
MAKEIRSATTLVNTILADKELVEELKTNPEKVLKEQSKEVLSGIGGIAKAGEADKWIWRMVIGALLLGVVIASISLAVLAYHGKPEQSGLLSIGTACVAALAGLLAPSPVNPQ